MTVTNIVLFTLMFILQMELFKIYEPSHVNEIW